MNTFPKTKPRRTEVICIKKLKEKVIKELTQKPEYKKERQALDEISTISVTDLLVELIEVFPPNKLFKRD